MPPVELNPLFELVVDGHTIGAFNREQLTAIRAAIARLLIGDTAMGESISKISTYFDIDLAVLIFDKRRNEELIWPRQLTIALLNEQGFSHHAIGRTFEKDRGTVRYSLLRVAEQIQTEPRKAKQLEALRALLTKSVPSV